MIKFVSITFLLFSALNVAIVLAQCPTCGGTGEIACPYCNGYGYILKPKISILVTQFWTNEGGVIVEGTFKKGHVYIDTTRDPALDGEGYAREIMRRVQQLRKDAGLQKEDSVKLFISVDKDLQAMLDPHVDLIKDKCGSTELSFVDDLGELKNKATETIKGKQILLGFE